MFTRHGIKVGRGPRDPGPWDPEAWDYPQSLKVGPGTFLKFKNETQGGRQSLKKAPEDANSKFKSGTHIMIFLHCFTYFILYDYFILYEKLRTLFKEIIFP